MPKAVTASTQDHLPIEDIIDDIVVLKGGSAAIVIQTTAVNFGLLSEKEQDATIFAYGALLNSLSHPVQILIRSKKTDISTYLEQLEGAFSKQTNPSLKAQIGKYIDFVKATVQKGRVLDKKFYIIIPFSFLELGAAKATRGLMRKKALPYPKEYIIEQARINLYPKKDQLLRQLSRLGLKGQVLTQPELAELFFDIYNPAATGSQKITVEAGTYTGAIVEPAVDAPAQTPAQEPAPLPPQTPPVLTTPKSPTASPQPQIVLTGPPGPSSQSTTPIIAPTLQSATEKDLAKGESQNLKTFVASGNLTGEHPGKQTSQLDAGDSAKILKELQDVIDKARTDLAVQIQGPQPAGVRQPTVNTASPLEVKAKIPETEKPTEETILKSAKSDQK